MLRKPIVVLAIALALGSSALSTSAFARGGGRDFGRSDFVACFVGSRMNGGCRSYDDLVKGLHVPDHGYGRGDVWGRWGSYYGPMVH
jgi:hypothetical protein